MTKYKQKFSVKSEEKITRLSSALRKNLQRRKVVRNAGKIKN